MSVVRDSIGAAWEKRGNTLWVQCPACAGWFPASPAMTRPEAPAAHCPHCHAEFKLGAASTPDNNT